MSPDQEQRGVLRTRVEQVPRFRSPRNPPNPKPGGREGDFIPTPAYQEEVESFHTEKRVVYP